MNNSERPPILWIAWGCLRVAVIYFPVFWHLKIKPGIIIVSTTSSRFLVRGNSDIRFGISHVAWTWLWWIVCVGRLCRVCESLFNFVPSRSKWFHMSWCESLWPIHQLILMYSADACPSQEKNDFYEGVCKKQPADRSARKLIVADLAILEAHEMGIDWFAFLVSWLQQERFLSRLFRKLGQCHTIIPWFQLWSFGSPGFCLGRTSFTDTFGLVPQKKGKR